MVMQNTSRHACHMYSYLTFKHFLPNSIIMEDVLIMKVESLNTKY